MKMHYILSTGLLVAGCAKAAPLAIVEPGPSTLDVTEAVYEACGAELGPLAKQVTVKHVVETAAMFGNASDRRAFIILVCIESRFNSGAKSRVGAVGLTQVMPKYADSFAADCYTSTKPLDLWVPEVNLRVGACQFLKLLIQYKGRYSLALAAYNAGAESPTVKRLRRHERVNPETAAYIAQFWNIWEATQEDESGVHMPTRVTGLSVNGGDF